MQQEKEGSISKTALICIWNITDSLDLDQEIEIQDGLIHFFYIGQNRVLLFKEQELQIFDLATKAAVKTRTYLPELPEGSEIGHSICNVIKATKKKAYFLTVNQKIYSIDLELKEPFEAIYENTNAKLYPQMIWVSSNDLYTLISSLDKGSQQN